MTDPLRVDYKHTGQKDPERYFDRSQAAGQKIQKDILTKYYVHFQTNPR